MGSILLPSYKVNPCVREDGISKKFAFKVGFVVIIVQTIHPSQQRLFIVHLLQPITLMIKVKTFYRALLPSRMGSKAEKNVNNYHVPTKEMCKCSCTGHVIATVMKTLTFTLSFLCESSLFSSSQRNWTNSQIIIY